MNNKSGDIYSKCVELSIKSTYDSLNKLLDIYISSSTTTRNTAKGALKKTKNQRLLIELINKRLDNCKSSEKEFLLLKLGYSISRSVYLYRYLCYCKDNEIDLKSIGFFKNITQEPFKQDKRDALAKYIIENNEYSLSLFEIAGNREKLLSAIWSYIENNGIDDSVKIILNKVVIDIDKYQDELYKCIKNNLMANISLCAYLNPKIEKNQLLILEYITKYGIENAMLDDFIMYNDIMDLLQDEIYNVVVKNCIGNYKYCKYLDFSLEKNHELLESYSLITLYCMLKENIYIDEILYSEINKVRIVLNIIKKETLAEDEWIEIYKNVNVEIENDLEIQNKTNLIKFLEGLKELNVIYYEEVYITIYKKTRLYTDFALNKLIEIKSSYAYREMISFMLTSDDRSKRVKYAVKLTMKYPEKYQSIYSYALELNDGKMISTLEEVSSRFAKNIQLHDNKNTVQELMIQKDEFFDVKILPHNTIISELLFDLARDINANYFCSAVGFTFSSGLKMLTPLMKLIYDNDGELELIIGALQNVNQGGKMFKIDLGSAIYINRLISDFKLKLYSYSNTFYHGKFYYLSNNTKAYVILGSSNISKTAFLDNYELDIVITLDLNKNSGEYKNWFDSFKKECVQLPKLDLNQFEEFNWESELDIYSSKNIVRMTDDEINQRITNLTDEETKFRLNLWMKHSPSEIFSNLNIPSLPEYIVFIYAERGLAVFESFTPGNAYYTFRYYDLEALLQNVSLLTKTEMLVSSNFLSRGYHIHDKERLETKIKKLFSAR